MELRNFLFYVLKVFLILICLAIVLDKVYSYSFLQSDKRGKVGYIYNSKPQQYDVVILGSSRSENHFVTQMFLDKGLKTFNFGLQGGKLFEADLILKLLLEKKNKIKNVIIDVDVTLKTERRSEANFLQFLPYLYSSNSVKAQFQSLDDFNDFYYIPFYRYLKYDTKIGLREAFFNVLNKKNNESANGGYYELKQKPKHLPSERLNFEPRKNKYYEEIKRICKLYNINLIPIMTPMCENTIGKDYFLKVNKLYPEIYNYQDKVIEDKYFSSCAHMNGDGAKLFTAIILKDFFNK